MSFIREDAAEVLARYKAPLICAAVFALGAYWAFFTFGILPWIGWAVMIASALFALSYVQKLRVRQRTGGPGVIELDERRLAYLHPQYGTLVDLPAVVRIEIETTGDGPFEDDLFWRFFTSEGLAARIPGSAVGADKLFDALAGFKGADYAAVIEASASVERQLFVIWRKDALTRIDTPRPPLHS